MLVISPPLMALGTLKKVLQVAYDPARAEERHALLAKAGYRVVTAHTNSEARDACGEHTFNAVLLGYAAPLPIRSEMFLWLRQNCPGAPIVSLYSRNFVPIPQADHKADGDDHRVWMGILSRLIN